MVVVFKWVGLNETVCLLGAWSEFPGIAGSDYECQCDEKPCVSDCLNGGGGDVYQVIIMTTRRVVNTSQNQKGSGSYSPDSV